VGIEPSRVSTFLGRGSVAMFFLITAFLFWGRIIESKERFDATRFYRNRIRRLLPMYLASAGLVAVTAMALSQFHPKVPLCALTSQIASWLLFTFPGVPPINGFTQTALINTVFWSLIYEWKFYLMLPMIGALAVRWGMWPVGLAACACIALFSPSQVEWYFDAGCAAAMAVRVPAVQNLRRSIVATALLIARIAAVVTWQPLIYSPSAAALTSVPFLLISGGNSLFGLLTNKAARLLGMLSYSIYLLHNWVLYLVARLVNHIVPIASISHVTYLGIRAGVVVITVLLAMLSYRFIEFPPIRLPSAATQLERSRAV